MSFLELDASDELFMSAKKVDEFMKDDVVVFMILASMKAETKVVLDELPVVSEYSKVFPDDIIDLLLECEVEFSIDLVPGISLVLMAPYRMFASEMSELKEKLEDMIEKRSLFILVFHRRVYRCC